MYTKICVVLCLLLAVSCSGGDQFASYQKEIFDETPIGSSITKEIILQNPSLNEVQHITGLNFDTGTNSAGHFHIEKVEVGGVVANPRDKDISVPVGSILQIYVTYQPLNMDTSIANYGGWTTGKPERWVPQKPEEVMATLLKPTIHRAILAVVYDHPKEGLVQVELVGESVPGPNGEITAGGGMGASECPTEAGTACYSGGFSIDLPDIVTTGPKPLKLTGPIVFELSGSAVSLDMTTFPAALLVLKGNGPGEPLEGKPINAVSIIISGKEGSAANGTFDGSNLELNDVEFRIRVVLGEITEADITPGLQAAVDFTVKGLTITTSKPYTNGSITLSVETTLPTGPSGNPMFDQFLGGTRVLVKMDGMLSIL